MKKPTPEQIKEAASKITNYFGGYFAIWTIDLGLRKGLFAEIAKHPQGISSKSLAKKLNFDHLYIDVWCRNAYGAELLEIKDESYVLPLNLATLLLDRDSPFYVSGTAQALVGLRDVFVSLRSWIKTGKHIWWDSTPREFVDAVAESSRPFYSRLLNFVENNSNLKDRLTNKETLLEVGVGYGTGLIRFAQKYPRAKFIGVDGDSYSLKQAKANFTKTKLADRVRFVKSTFEDLSLSEVADIALINISLHEARDKKQAVKAMYKALKRGGVILVSEFPYPETPEGLKTPPARVMSGVQYFEAAINDQLMPTKQFVNLLSAVGFQNIEIFELAPVHIVILGYK